MSKVKRFWKAIREEQREHKSSFYVYMVLHILVLIVLCTQLVQRNFETAFLAILTLLLMIIPSFVQVTFKVELPTKLEIIVLIFIFAAQILGEIKGFYVKYPWWDDVLHTLNGFLSAAIGFSMVDILNKDENLVFNLSPFFAVMVAFCFSMTVGIVWEIFEFSMDQIAGFDMQKDTVINWISSVNLDPTGGNTPTAIRDINEVYIHGEPLGVGGYLDVGLYDTMKDLMENVVGAFVFSWIGYIYLKHPGKEKEKWINSFMMRRKRKE